MSARLVSACPILPGRDLEKAEAFWSNLGFATRYLDPAVYLMLERDGVELHFFRHPALDPGENDAGAYLRVEDLAALDTEWAALDLPSTGIPRLDRAENKPWGMRELALVDPDGNLVRVGEEIDGGEGRS